MRLVKPSFEISGHMEYTAMLAIVARAISNCYKAEVPKGQKACEDFIRPRIAAGHLSVIEHCSFTADLVVDRGITHELVRHRLASYSQESSRFCNYSKGKFDGHVTFVMPKWVSDVVPAGVYPSIMIDNNTSVVIHDANGNDGMRIDQQDIATWLVGLLNAEQYYMELLRLGRAPQEARSLLPNATKAEITVSANLRQWRHMFNLRALGTAGVPHPDMLEIMVPLLAEAKQRFPVFFEDL